jgi:hypothetical protein
VIEHVTENLRELQGAPSVMMQEVPSDLLVANPPTDDDDPDVRESQRCSGRPTDRKSVV